MVFSELIERLSKECTVEVISNRGETEITRVQLLDPRQEVFEEDTLYLAYSAKHVLQSPPQCIMAGMEECKGMHGDALNLAMVSQEEFSYAFNNVSRWIENAGKDGFYNIMAETAERVKNVDVLIDIASQKFGASMILIDRNFRILSYSNQVPVTDKLWKRNIQQGYCDYEFIKAVLSLRSVEEGKDANIIEVSCTSSPFQKFACKVFCQGKWIGYVIVIEGYDSYRPEHVDMLQSVSKVLSQAILRYAPQYLYMTNEYHDFLYRLMIGADVRTMPESYRMLSFPAEMRVFYCEAMNKDSRFPKEGELSDQLSGILPGCHVIAHRNNAYVLGAADVLAKVGILYGTFPAECDIRIGVSNVFTDIAELRRNTDDAIAAVDIGYDLEPDLTIYEFKEYSMYMMFQLLEEQGTDLHRFLHPALTKLMRKDAASEGSLVRTLYEYLQQNCNTTETAEALFMHRNSVIYRLHKIEEICGINLQDPDLCFQLRLSYSILSMINHKRDWRRELRKQA